jgi:hypothetical protein
MVVKVSRDASWRGGDEEGMMIIMPGAMVVVARMVMETAPSRDRTGSPAYLAKWRGLGDIARQDPPAGGRIPAFRSVDAPSVGLGDLSPA